MGQFAEVRNALVRSQGPRKRIGESDGVRREGPQAAGLERSRAFVRGETRGTNVACSQSVPRQFYEYEIRGRSVAYCTTARGGARCPLRSIILGTPAVLALHKVAREHCRISLPRDDVGRVKPNAHIRARRRVRHAKVASL